MELHNYDDANIDFQRAKELNPSKKLYNFL